MITADVVNFVFTFAGTRRILWGENNNVITSTKRFSCICNFFPSAFTRRLKPFWERVLKQSRNGSMCVWTTEPLLLKRFQMCPRNGFDLDPFLDHYLLLRVNATLVKHHLCFFTLSSFVSLKLKAFIFCPERKAMHYFSEKNDHVFESTWKGRIWRPSVSGTAECSTIFQMFISCELFSSLVSFIASCYSRYLTSHRMPLFNGTKSINVPPFAFSPHV